MAVYRPINLNRKAGETKKSGGGPLEEGEEEAERRVKRMAKQPTMPPPPYTVEESPTKTCFGICPIGDDGSEIRRRSNLIMKTIIIPAAKNCGFSDENVIRADLLQSPGVITT
jgi:hypothetical protein